MTREARFAVGGELARGRDDDALPPEAPLLPERIKPFLEPEAHVCWKRTTGSTNDDAKEAWTAGLRGPAVFVAELQTGGRGRMSRRWRSGNGTSVEMSLLIPTDVPARAAQGLSLAAGLGVQRGIREATGLDAKIKWPNDIVAGDRKLAGILVETSVADGVLQYVVIGIGINVNQETFDAPLRDKATSIRMLTGNGADRATVCGAVAGCVISLVHTFLAGGGAALMREYERASAVFGRDVAVLSPAGTTYGRCVGFTDTGEIRVSEGEQVRSYNASEISVRGASSYV